MACKQTQEREGEESKSKSHSLRRALWTRRAAAGASYHIILLVCYYYEVLSKSVYWVSLLSLSLSRSILFCLDIIENIIVSLFKRTYYYYVVAPRQQQLRF